MPRAPGLVSLAELAGSAAAAAGDGDGVADGARVGALGAAGSNDVAIVAAGNGQRLPTVCNDEERGGGFL